MPLINFRADYKLWSLMIFAPFLWHSICYVPIPSLKITHSYHLEQPKLWPEKPALPITYAQSVFHQNDSSSEYSSKPIAIIGDTRASAANLGPSSRWPSLVSSIKAKQPIALLHLGDWVQDGTNLKQWQQTLRSLTLLSPIPLLTVRGNHDRGGLFEQLAFTPKPHSPLRISRIGGILFFLMDSEVSTHLAQSTVRKLLTEIKSHAQEWSEEALARQGIYAKVWVQHRPVWSSGNHGSDERGWRSWLVPALETLDIDLMLAGHDHDYERFCPSIGVDQDRICDNQGVTYVVSGGGATVTVPFPNLSWKEPLSSKLQNNRHRIIFSDQPHFLTLRLDKSALYLKVWSTQYSGYSQLLDQVIIHTKID
jgi:predicted phosphodiesterase